MVAWGIFGVGEDFPALRPQLHIPWAGCAPSLRATGTTAHMEVVSILTSPIVQVLLTPLLLSMRAPRISLSSPFSTYTKSLLCLCSLCVHPHS